MKLFQIEEPDGSPVDPDAPGAAIGIDASGAEAEIAFALGGNAVVLADREGFELSLPVPAQPNGDWRRLFEGARLRAERALARPVTHAVIALRQPADPILLAVLHAAAAESGVKLLQVIGTEGAGGYEGHACAAAVLAEDLAPRPEAP